MIEHIFYIAQQPRGPGGLGSFLPMIIILGVIFYFLILRPQQKQRKEHQIMLDNLKKGDKVITIGGIHGMITNIKDKDKIIVVKIADNVKIELSRSSITQVAKSKTAEEEVSQPRS